MTLSKSVIALALTSGMIFSSVVAAADEQLRELSLPASSLTGLNAEVGAGGFTLKTSADTDTVTVTALIGHQGDREPELKLEQRGNDAFLVAKFPANTSWFGKSPYIDITVTVPANFNLELEDGSGDIHISGLKGNIKVKDGSGNIELMGGNTVSIEDGSGDIELTDIVGTLSITDGSGDIDISNVGGNTHIKDGSGNIQASDINANIEINDGSGNIDVSRVAAKVEITDGSGNIKVSDAESLVLHETGSGNVTSNNIRSGVTL
ncbi:DUF4097 family beta strand repeat-containing protein [Shewanella sp.]|uniref:DUF4097 family beta strand repeat-containing protein n=1 Tax=Shewanella sp. TaxID=50422 RepID=UPI003565A309